MERDCNVYIQVARIRQQVAISGHISADTIVPTDAVVPAAAGKRALSRSASLDGTDRRILEVLQRDGRITNAALAERVSLSESACLRRVHALEHSGLISGYGARIDPQMVGLPVSVFVSITLDRQDQTDLKVFEDAVRRIPEVMECYLMTGDFDYLVRVAVADTADFERVHSQALTRLPGVARVHSSFALRTVTQVSALPIR